MEQPIANITLKLEKNGSSVQLKNVTPAEVMLLCAMHRRNAGGDPILKLTLLDKGVYEKEREQQQTLLDKLEADYTRVEEDEALLEDVREKRLEAIRKRIETRQSTIHGMDQVAAIRNLNPQQEYTRLGFKYNDTVLKEFYPGRIPNLPTTFEEAREQGIRTNVVEAKWIVGNNKYANG